MPLSFSFNHRGFWLIYMRSFIYMVYIYINEYVRYHVAVCVCLYLYGWGTNTIHLWSYIISKHKFINLKLTRPLYQSMCENLQRINGVLYYWWRHCLISKEFETTEIQKTINHKFDAKKIYFTKVDPLLSVIVISFIRIKKWNKLYKMSLFLSTFLARKHCMMYY